MSSLFYIVCLVVGVSLVTGGFGIGAWMDGWYWRGHSLCRGRKLDGGSHEAMMTSAQGRGSRVSERRDEMDENVVSLSETKEQMTKERLAAIRERLVGALRGDKEALHVLQMVWPESWNDGCFAALWMLGNAARFADDPWPTNPQEWLDRLVWPDGEPKDAS
jgi:hypothetical protein